MKARQQGHSTDRSQFRQSWLHPFQRQDLSAGLWRQRWRIVLYGAVIPCFGEPHYSRVIIVVHVNSESTMIPLLHYIVNFLLIDPLLDEQLVSIL
jgi:hypothetical protein